MLIAASLATKLALLHLNQAEYTDGILQITFLQNRSGLYPPLYGGLAMLLSRCGTDTETAAKLISIIAATLTLIPVFYTAKRLVDVNAARFAGLFLVISPLAVRWSARVMSDSLYTFFSAATLWLSIFTADSGTEPHERRRADRVLALACVFGALATLTRYQGWLLGLPIALSFLRFFRRYRCVPVLSLVVFVAAWTLPLWWGLTQARVHAQQFSDRTSGPLMPVLLGWLNLLESFILTMPYYFGYPVFAFGVAGFFALRRPDAWQRAFLLGWGVFVAGTIALQSVFGSFQFRYLLPLLPLALILAGCGAALAENRMGARGHAGLFRALVLASIIYLTVFGSAVLVLQRQSLGDQKSAALLLKERFPRGTPVFSNELYGSFTNLACLKLSYWSGHDVHPIAGYLPREPGTWPKQQLPAGAVVVLGNCYGGDAILDQTLSQLTYFYHLREVGSFNSTVYAIFEDIMVNPALNQNPLGWVMRYTAQFFSTHILLIERPRSQEEIRQLIQRQVAPPGMRPVVGPDGRLAVIADGLTSGSREDSSPK